MMQGILGVVLLVNFVLGTIVGTRLLRIRSETWWTPERMLGCFFVVSHVMGGILVTAAYGVWSQSGQVECPPWLVMMHGVGQLCLLVGYVMIYAFTQRTFYADSAKAKAFVLTMCGLAVFSFMGRLFVEGFAITVDPGPMHWLFLAGRLVSLAWVSFAAITYWSRMRKRVSLGLADPLVSNRFLLWGLWAGGNCLTALSEPIARLVYGMLAGDSAGLASSIQGTAGPLLQVTLIVTSILCTFTSSMLWLAFFPTQGYRRWVIARAQAAQT